MHVPHDRRPRREVAAPADLPDPLDDVHEVLEELADVEVPARGRVVELVEADGGDDVGGQGEGSREQRTRVVVVAADERGGRAGDRGREEHAHSLRPETGHLVAGSGWQDRVVRADRLVAILLLLQARGQVTAAEVAAELEVSERTARRDLEALGMAGLPIYSRQGRNGGWQLAGGGRTDLSGLTAHEARALFLVAGPASATPEVKAALRKLVRALPEGFREAAEAASSAVVVDPVGWDQVGGMRRDPPYLEAVQRAVVEGEQIRIDYVARDRAASSRVVHPLGVAAKGPAWYLVAATEAGLRTFRIDRMTSVEPTGEAVVRPEGFELAEAWRLITDEVEQRRAPVQARAMAHPHAVGWCRSSMGNRVRIGAAGPDGRVELELRGRSPRSLAAELAGFGDLVEVLEPAEVREHLAAIGAELAKVYADEPDPGV